MTIRLQWQWTYIIDNLRQFSSCFVQSTNGNEVFNITLTILRAQLLCGCVCVLCGCVCCVRVCLTLRNLLYTRTAISWMSWLLTNLRYSGHTLLCCVRGRALRARSKVLLVRVILHCSIRNWQYSSQIRGICSGEQKMQLMQWWWDSYTQHYSTKFPHTTGTIMLVLPSFSGLENCG